MVNKYMIFKIYLCTYGVNKLSSQIIYFLLFPSLSISFHSFRKCFSIIYLIDLLFLGSQYHSPSILPRGDKRVIRIRKQHLHHKNPVVVGSIQQRDKKFKSSSQGFHEVSLSIESVDLYSISLIETDFKERLDIKLKDLEVLLPSHHDFLELNNSSFHIQIDSCQLSNARHWVKSSSYNLKNSTLILTKTTIKEGAFDLRFCHFKAQDVTYTADQRTSCFIAAMLYLTTLNCLSTCHTMIYLF